MFSPRGSLSALALIISLLAKNARAEDTPLIAVELAPMVSYRTFRDREPTSADKNYSTTAMAGAALSARFFPFSQRTNSLAGLGAYARGTMNFLSSQDVDIAPDKAGHNVSTSFVRASVGVLYRIAPHARSPLGVTLVGGVDRWAFSFDMPTPPLQLTPTARYSFARAGAEVELALGRAALRATAQVLLPWSIDDLGDRPAISKGWGAHAGLRASYPVAPHLALVAHAHYTLFVFDLPQILPRSAENATVHDRYLDFLLGAQLSW